MAPGDLTVKVDLGDVMVLLTTILGRVMATQADVEAMAGRMADAADALNSTAQAIAANTAESLAATNDTRADIADLKQKLADAGVTLDLTSLDTNLTRITDAAQKLSANTGQLTDAVDASQALAAENPPPDQPAPPGP